MTPGGRRLPGDRAIGTGSRRDCLQRPVGPTLGRMTWMVTGGAGYIGAHIVKSLKELRIRRRRLDDLSTGEARKVPSDVPLVEASVLDGPPSRRHSVSTT